MLDSCAPESKQVLTDVEFLECLQMGQALLCSGIVTWLHNSVLLCSMVGDFEELLGKVGNSRSDTVQ
ncbi:hypothetical protein AOLI_G00240960 [Acnodon oligacanthus]